MENIQQKADFLRYEYTKQLLLLDVNAPRLWGKMNVQQMIEHMADYVRIGSGKIIEKLVTPTEHLSKMQAFLNTEKPFRENTPNVLMSEIPMPVKHATVKEAINELQSELDYFFGVFKNEPGKKVTNPFFGELDYEMSVQLLHKHATHHLRQFGVGV